MSLMLDALKRIEAKRASARPPAFATVAAIEPPHAVFAASPGPAPGPPDEAFSESDALAPMEAVAVAAPPELEPIELPRELTADDAAELTLEEVALPGDVSLETAVDELSDLLAEARQLDQPLPAPEPADLGSLQEELDRACRTGFGDGPEASPVVVLQPAPHTVSNGEFTIALSKPSQAAEMPDPAAGAARLDALSQENVPASTASDRADYRDPHAHDVYISGGYEYQTGHSLGAVEVFAAAAPTPEMVRATLESINAALARPPAETALPEEPEAAQVVAEPMVVNPLGSDPYAAAAWQVLRQLSGGTDRRSHVLLFTSPGDGHGKTTTIARLLPHVARSFSGSVLVVDANTRNPELARRLEVAATWRLTDVLAGATHWMNAVRPTALPRVSLLPGGMEPSRRPNVQAASGLLRELSGHYDLLLVDATSLAHEGAAQLAAACDGTCLVVRLGEGNRRIVRDAVRVLNRSGGRLLGCIAIDAGA
jgi:Mrp family chromosome partitioning ATPase